MIKHILTYQNDYVYSNLFRHNFVDLLNKGVKLKSLVASKIFNHTFDFDAWPATSTDDRKLLVLYNSSVFDLRHKYPDVFPELHKAE